MRTLCSHRQKTASESVLGIHEADTEWSARRRLGELINRYRIPTAVREQAEQDEELAAPVRERIVALTRQEPTQFPSTNEVIEAALAYVVDKDREPQDYTVALEWIHAIQQQQRSIRIPKFFAAAAGAEYRTGDYREAKQSANTALSPFPLARSRSFRRASHCIIVLCHVVQTTKRRESGPTIASRGQAHGQLGKGNR